MQIATTKRERLYAIVALAGGILGGLAGGRFSATAAAGATQTPPRTIAAQQILLVDAKGDTRGAFSLNKDGDAGLSLYDHQGKARIAIQISSNDGLGFEVFNPAGVLRISLTLNVDQIPTLRLFDAQHRPRALLGVDPNGEAALAFYSEEGKLLRELP